MKHFLSLACALCLVIGCAADSLPLNQLPMYGGREKTAEMKKADADFIDAIAKQGLSREDGAKKAVQAGWALFKKKDLATAMKRFNQAWLLDPENGNIYHGFAVVTSERGGSPPEVENLFRLALSKPKVDAEAFVDYGRFLRTQKQYEKSLIQLNKALDRSSKAFNARSQISFVYYLKGDFSNACEWAKAAQKNGDELEAGFLEDMCRRSSVRTDQPREITGKDSAPMVPVPADSQLDLKRLEYAKKVIRDYGDKIPPQVQQDILAQRVTLGMPPYEASLAAGAYAFHVIADPTKWPKDADPYKVIGAQTMHPDDSQIWLTFQTATQFPEKGMTRFQVFFRGGKALEIKELTSGPGNEKAIDQDQQQKQQSPTTQPQETTGKDSAPSVLAPAGAEGIAKLTLHSEPGDFVGRGLDTEITFMREDIFITPHVNAFISGKPAQLGFRFFNIHKKPDNDASLSFSTKQLGIPLQPGTFADAERAFNASQGHPGLDIGFDHRGCNKVTGNYTITEVSFLPGNVINTFAASFEQHCEGKSPALWGTFTYSRSGMLPVSPNPKEPSTQDATK